MRSRLSILGLVLILGGLILNGCGPVTEQPTELPTATPTAAAVEGPDPVRARDAALAYVIGHYGEQAPWRNLIWLGEEISPERLVGHAAYQYGAADWVITISCPTAAPEAVVYSVVVANQTTGFQWEGEVDAAGQVTETAAPTEGHPVVCWYGRVVGLPEGAQFDDYLALQPEGAGEIGVEGAKAEIEAQIEALRDKAEPWNYAHFWGTLACDLLDYGGCQLLVTRLRPEGPEGPFFDPDPVEGWEGTIISNPPDAQFDDYFVLAGDLPVGFGIDSSDPEVAGQLETVRDTATTIHVWGEVTCPAIDSFGTHVVATRIEIEP
jgi:hypothetical protein